MSLARALDTVLQQAVERGDVPGVVAFVANDQGLLYEGAFGVRTVGQPDPMSRDAVFWIASMTKPITTVAALQLVEQGKLSLDAPVGLIVPELAEPQVLEGFDESGKPKLRSASRPLTLRHLLTHTSGFSYDFLSSDYQRYMAITGLPSIGTCQRAALALPLLFEPGERWEYGISIDWVGQIVERVTGESLEEYFGKHIFDPLGMRDTRFLLRPDMQARRAGMHLRQPDQRLVPIPFEVPQQPEFFMGGGGLYSTGPDYITFLRMILRGGELDGARILQPETVVAMGTNQIGALAVGALVSADPTQARDLEYFPGLRKKWGFGFMILEEDAPTGRSAGSLAWGGLANTTFWIDPAKRVAAVILLQVLPSGDPLALQLFEAFERALYTQLATR
ncbi:serine hydrolase domain-containing protein [Thermorudis peleae]|uniref:serine hydrolase domain-containing protein n=1 Tax=Thermorudis peleae TaxID=1382356 RepID=UPI00056F98B3|nr:serine hydrolase domain-containing protein [Thermorudis peleae]MBX6752782.1 beta-lactamase family protein [Thermorudis peleae]